MMLRWSMCVCSTIPQPNGRAKCVECADASVRVEFVAAFDLATGGAPVCTLSWRRIE
jgi:hypothetical protein